MINSKVSWRSGLSKKSGTLSLDERLKLTEETGDIIFDVSPSEIKSFKIQGHYMYPKVGRKLYTLNFSPDIDARVESGAVEQSDSFEYSAARIVEEWKEALRSKGIRKVKSITWWQIIATLAALSSILKLLT